MDYNGLKKLLKKMQTPLSSITSDEFKLSIDQEIEKVVLFFLHQQGLIANELSTLRQKKSKILHNSEAAYVSEEYRRVGFKLIDLVHFVELNVTGLRKILKKVIQFNLFHVH